MKACVDRDTCIGCGLCADVCPGVFYMEDQLANTQGDVPEDAQSSAVDAADSCPVNAITVE